MSNLNRKYKDRVFCAFFGSEENRDRLLSLYNALNDRDYQDTDGLVINTLENAIYMSMNNDVSCIVDNHMVLFEHQSSVNPNMPLRGLLYLSREYDAYAEKAGLNRFGKRLEKIPTPKYFVLYNGIDRMPDRSVLRLSDAFMHPDPEAALECTAIVLNINVGHNRELMEACRVLWEYSMFVDISRRELNAGKTDGRSRTQCMSDAIDKCTRQGIMEDFLRKHKAEVIGMYLEEYNEEETMQMFREEGWEDGRENGIAFGKRNNQLETARRMLAKGLDLELISQCTELDMQDVLKLTETASDE